MTLTDLKNQILSLSTSDKVSILESLLESISSENRGISKTSGVCGGSACIFGTRIPVWILVEARQLGISESQLLADYPHLNAADLVNAWAYEKAYPEEIEGEIRANEVRN